MKRHNWVQDFQALIDQNMNRDFEWGIFDCCLFTADCCDVICGKDPAALYRDRYTSEVGAKRILVKEHGSVQAAFSATFEEIDPAFVQRGDAVMFSDQFGETMGIAWVGGVWSLGLNGLRFLQVEVLKAWRVE